MTVDDLIKAMTPSVYKNLRHSVELGHWPDGRRLQSGQAELCTEAMIRYEAMAGVPEQERVGLHGGCLQVFIARRCSAFSDPIVMPSVAGHLQKMVTHLDAQGSVHYQLVLDDQRLALNPLLGQKISLSHVGAIHCQHCGRKTNKSFSQGYCYPCFKALPQCDLCIMSPERCHYDQGTCRDAAWGDDFCMRDHIVYLANSSGVKVGITRGTQVPTRWCDQGAIQALPILRVRTRHLSGLVESLFKQAVADKTNWRTMLKGQVETLDLTRVRNHLYQMFERELNELELQHGPGSLHYLEQPSFRLNYPVVHYPEKVSSLNLDKTPHVQGVLQGIKGQYLILDSGVINIRKYTAYQVEFNY